MKKFLALAMTVIMLAGMAFGVCAETLTDTGTSTIQATLKVTDIELTDQSEFSVEITWGTPTFELTRNVFWDADEKKYEMQGTYKWADGKNGLDITIKNNSNVPVFATFGFENSDGQYFSGFEIYFYEKVANGDYTGSTPLNYIEIPKVDVSTGSAVVSSKSIFATFVGELNIPGEIPVDQNGEIKLGKFSVTISKTAPTYE